MAVDGYGWWYGSRIGGMMDKVGIMMYAWCVCSRKQKGKNRNGREEEIWGESRL